MPDVRVLDTAGILSEGRLVALLCSACVDKVAPHHRLRSRRLRLQAGQAVVFGGLAAVTVQAVAPAEQAALMLVFMSAEVSLQRAPAAAIDEFLQGSTADWRFDVCAGCGEHLTQCGWEEVEVVVGPTQDLALQGLGWLSVRKNTVTLRTLVPAGTHVSLRPHFIGPRPRPKK